MTPNCPMYNAPEPTVQIILHSKDKRWQEIEAVTVFVLWRERRRRIFTENSNDVVQLTAEII
jgi:hypothetical protein